MSERLPQLEFSRPLRVDRIPKSGSVEKITADPSECKALARRLGVPVVHGLSAQLRASPWRGGGLKLEGELVADIDQVSVISLESFRSSQRFPLVRYFLPESALTDEDDADPIVNGHVDVGEAVAEVLALELDPYPRKPGEDFSGPKDGEQEPESTSPFAGLKKSLNSRT